MTENRLDVRWSHLKYKMYVLFCARAMSDRYPDREIEFQLQFDVPEQQFTYHPKMEALRSSINSEINGIRRADLDNQTPTKTTKREIVTSTTAMTLPITEQDQPDAKQIPIYLDDLKNAIEDFERKQQLQTDKPCGNTGKTEPPTTKQSQFSATPATNRRLQEILQLIGKGVNIQFNVPRPTEGNLNWFQVKIPT